MAPFHPAPRRPLPSLSFALRRRNIVFLGPRLDYIDYDTRDRTYDAHVVHAYEVMEVLFNYKRACPSQA